MTGQRVGYKRTSTAQQHTDRQLDGLEFDKVFEDKLSGKDANRPALIEMLDYVRAGDIIFIHDLSRLARNLVDLRQIVASLTGRGVRVKFVTENMEFGGGKENAMNELLFNILGAFAQWERTVLLERQREGIAAYRTRRGAAAYPGRKPSLTAAQIEEVRQRAGAGESKTVLASEFSVSRQTIYSTLK